MNKQKIIEICNERIENLSEAKGIIDGNRGLLRNTSDFNTMMVSKLEIMIKGEIEVFKEIRNLCKNM